MGFFENNAALFYLSVGVVAVVFGYLGGALQTALGRTARRG